MTEDADTILVHIQFGETERSVMFRTPKVMTATAIVVTLAIMTFCEAYALRWEENDSFSFIFCAYFTVHETKVTIQTNIRNKIVITLKSRRETKQTMVS